MSGNEFDNFQANFFRNLPNLRHLNINNNKVTLIDSIFGWNITTDYLLFFLLLQLTLIRELQFDQNPRLQVLTMADNLIEQLHNNVFLNNPALEHLDLSSNNLSRLSGLLLRANSRLLSLGLRNCNINAIQSNFFANNPNLQIINLQSNQCVDRWFSIFRPIEVDVTPYLDVCFRNF